VRRLLLLAALAPAVLAAQQAAAPRFQRQTRPERTAYRETSSYGDVVAFLAAADAASSRIHVTHFGYSMEGRTLPLAVVGRVRDASPEAVRASGKLRVFIQANIHAGEVEGKEAMQVLLRDLANGRHAVWLDSVVLLIAPIYNADGNERVRLTNRPLQDGPLGGMGQRANAQNLDLNRDHTKLESPEARSLISLFNRYDPHVVIDLHTTNGTVHAYHLTYAPPGRMTPRS
jgi:murein tripeptide amidase MpaA